MKCNYEDMKIGGKIHKEMKKNIINFLEPNMKLYDIAINIEDKIRDITNYDINNILNGGVAFPTGLSINNCAAHWTPNKGNDKILKYSDVIKIDYGIHINGSIPDSAFSFSFDEKFEKLLEASRTSTDLAKLARPDMLLSEIGREIEEI